MIHYHGGPLWPVEAAATLWKKRHGFVSHFRPDQIDVAAEQCQSFALDNGAFSCWKNGRQLPIDQYAEWVRRWAQHPGFDWCLAPDIIDGSEAENDAMLDAWYGDVPLHSSLSVPVYHLHESFERLARLAHAHPRVALGSSGKYAQIGTKAWQGRMADVMRVVCNTEGFPVTKLHGLRMLSPTVFSQIPLSSADSTNVARNIVTDKAWGGPYAPKSKATRALIIADNVEHHAAARRWVGTMGMQQNLDLMDALP